MVEGQKSLCMLTCGRLVVALSQDNSTREGQEKESE